MGLSRGLLLDQSPETESLAGAHFPYRRSCPRLLYPKQSVRSTKKIIKKDFTGKLCGTHFFSWYRSFSPSFSIWRTSENFSGRTQRLGTMKTFSRLTQRVKAFSSSTAENSGDE